MEADSGALTEPAVRGSGRIDAGLAGRAGLAATAVSVALTITIAAAGPSLMEPPLPGRPGPSASTWEPPWAFDAHLSPYLAVALAAVALITGALGLALTAWAARRGWMVSPRLILLAGVFVAAVLTLLPPFGSSDHLNYAAYGRMVVTGHNPYATGADVLARLGDPVGRAVEDWNKSPSVYGTLATGGEALASLIGGTSVRLTVFVLSLLNVAAFAGTGLLLHWLTRGDRRRQLRSALLWTCNPLLLYVLVAGEHVDSQAIFFCVAAVAALSRVLPRAGSVPPAGDTRRLVIAATAAGALVGLAFAVKLTMVLVGIGLAWACLVVLWPRPPWTARSLWTAQGRRLAAVIAGLAGGFAVTAGPALAIGGRDEVRQALAAGSYVSIGSPWRAVRSALRPVVGRGTPGDLVKAGAVVLAVVLVVLMLRGLPDGDIAQRAAFAFALAWLIAWPYVLPWYDPLAWALLPLLPWSTVDWLLGVRMVALAFGYLPARVSGITIPAGLGWLQSVVRTGITPAILTLVTICLVGRMRPGRRRGALSAGAQGVPAGQPNHLNGTFTPP